MSYNPSIGRFLETDPDRYIDGPNEYQLELSNPVDSIDPLGLSSTSASSTTQPAPPSPPVNQQVAADDMLQALQMAGANYAMNDSPYVPWGHDCVQQSQGLQDYLESIYAGNIPYWYIGTEQGKDPKGNCHNVVKLSPKPGNPLPPMILDSFHVPFGQRSCKLECYKDWKKHYPFK